MGSANSDSLPVVSCQGCGACCMQQESPPMYLYYLLNDDPEKFEYEDYDRFLGLPPDALKSLQDYAARLNRGEGHPNEGVCIWLDVKTRQCKYYDHRPTICEFALVRGDDGCLGWRDTYADMIKSESEVSQ